MDMLSFNTLLANCCVRCSNSMLDANVTGNDSGWNLDYLQLAGNLQ